MPVALLQCDNWDDWYHQGSGLMSALIHQWSQSLNRVLEDEDLREVGLAWKKQALRVCPWRRLSHAPDCYCFPLYPVCHEVKYSLPHVLAFCLDTWGQDPSPFHVQWQEARPPSGHITHGYGRSKYHDKQFCLDTWANQPWLKLWAKINNSPFRLFSRIFGPQVCKSSYYSRKKGNGW